MRRHYVFYGMVQGVGFRFRAYNAANMNGVSGFVRNLSDGSVEMEAEGSPEAIDKTIRDIERGGFIQIDSMEVKEIEEKGEGRFYVG